MAKTTPLAGDALVEWFEASRAISQPCRDAGAVLAVLNDSDNGFRNRPETGPLRACARYPDPDPAADPLRQPDEGAEKMD